uniref:Uncharacterized protein n=1 Tax=Pseudenhygromyxa salsuginis TaxID=442868 RepID=A0A3Q8I2P6_9BACT|nr:hypothetical protein [Pseudenhygromyxa salsuginis]
MTPRSTVSSVFRTPLALVFAAVAGLAAFAGSSQSSASQGAKTIPVYERTGDVTVCDAQTLKVRIVDGEVFLDFGNQRWHVVDGYVILGHHATSDTVLAFDVEGDGIYVSIDGIEQPSLAAVGGLTSYLVHDNTGILEFEVDDSGNFGNETRVPTVPDVVFEPTRDCPPSTDVFPEL